MVSYAFIAIHQIFVIQNLGFLNERINNIDLGYEHYELSSFGKPGFHSRNNTAYWQVTPVVRLA